MSFADEWAKESDNAIKAVEETVKVVAIELFSGVITSTPVGNENLWKSPNSAPPGYSGGTARSQWYLSFDSPSEKVNDDNDGGDRAVQDVEKISSDSYKGKYILSNNLPYIERLENGWSQQAVAGIVAPNVSRVSAAIPAIYAVSSKKYGVS